MDVNLAGTSQGAVTEDHPVYEKTDMKPSQEANFADSDGLQTIQQCHTTSPRIDRDVPTRNCSRTLSQNKTPEMPQARFTHWEFLKNIQLPKKTQTNNSELNSFGHYA